MHIHQSNSSAYVDETQASALEMIETAAAFLDCLRPDQRKKAVYSVGDDERLKWDYRPVPRAGLPLTKMDSSQQRRALTLLASGLSRRGNIKALNIMSLERILGSLEGPKSDFVRDPDLYFVTVFGEPSEEASWGWRFEGHHLSVNVLVVSGRYVACSPNFFGANPANVPKGSLRGFRTLSREEDVARRLLTELSDTQIERVVVNKTAPPDIITHWTSQIRLDDPVGLPYAELNQEQQKRMMDIIRLYIGRMAPRLADAQMNEVEKEGIGRIHYAWAGSKKSGRPHYYRLHGPTILIEYDNTQNNANHIHSVWRDLKRDWGQDLLSAHYESSHQALRNAR
jgi:hypothetical protein